MHIMKYFVVGFLYNDGVSETEQILQKKPKKTTQTNNKKCCV